MCPKVAHGMANSVEPYLTASVWSGSTLFVCYCRSRSDWSLDRLPRRVCQNNWYSLMSRFMTKLTKRHVHPAKTQISLGICPVWSESLLSAWRKLGSLATHWAHSRLISLDGCPGWSESSLGAESFRWFCHEAAVLSFFIIWTFQLDPERFFTLWF